MSMTKTNRELLTELRIRLRMTETDVAEFIVDKTKRPCSLRTVQAWTNDPTKASARKCPDWAIDLLREEISRRAQT